MWNFTTIMKTSSFLAQRFRNRRYFKIEVLYLSFTGVLLQNIISRRPGDGQQEYDAVKAKYTMSDISNARDGVSCTHILF